MYVDICCSCVGRFQCFKQLSQWGEKHTKVQLSAAARPNLSSRTKITTRIMIRLGAAVEFFPREGRALLMNPTCLNGGGGWTPRETGCSQNTSFVSRQDSREKPGFDAACGRNAIRISHLFFYLRKKHANLKIARGSVGIL